MFRGGFQFAVHQRRNKGEGVNLAVRMRHGHADRDAGIFEDENIGRIRLGGKLAVAPNPEVNDLSPVFDAELGRRQIVLRMIEDDVTGPARAGLPVEARGFLKRSVIRLKRGEIVGIEMNVVVIGNPSRARAKGAAILRKMRAILAVRRHHHPLTQ